MWKWASIGLTLFLATTAQAQQLAVSSHTLSNGLKLLIHTDHHIPNVAMYLFSVLSKLEKSADL
jgi:hypothetical protein